MKEYFFHGRLIYLLLTGEIMTTFSERLKNERLKKGFTQHTLPTTFQEDALLTPTGKMENVNQVSRH